MESGWIVPTWEINGDRIHSGTNVCFVRTCALPMALEQLSAGAIYWKTLGTDPSGCPSLTGCPFLFSWRCPYSPLPLGHGLCPTTESSTHQSGHGTQTQPRNLAGRNQLESSSTKTRGAPIGEALSSWCMKAWGQHGGTFIWWASLYFPSFISKFSPTKILPKTLLGRTHMIFAADHILLSLSSSWHTQLMSLQRTIHPLPNRTWIQPPFPSTPVKIEHDLWKHGLKNQRCADDAWLMNVWWPKLMRHDHVSLREIIVINHRTRGAHIMIESHGHLHRRLRCLPGG